MSQSAIGRVTGRAQQTIHDDLRATTYRSPVGCREPYVTHGLDGKTRTYQPRPNPEPEEEPLPTAPTRTLSQPQPPQYGRRPASREVVRRSVDQITTLCDLIRSQMSTPCSPDEAAEIARDLADAARALNQTRKHITTNGAQS